ncbi:uncharacterized protein PgNI_04632 [Pyricularia grisea]|uniref:Uncharacterized protein n=1 Tax=Pyricularia grisea TaxID=148305 RepID=A0A6P8BE19_PYRGI|nr:uncharacterized protein PgNI_04632 [Pyricularia grisea]TLD14126.1 hypothetical protein PgNI_04632 [Pyricularia grisea]
MTARIYLLHGYARDPDSVVLVELAVSTWLQTSHRIERIISSLAPDVVVKLPVWRPGKLGTWEWFFWWVPKVNGMGKALRKRNVVVFLGLGPYYCTFRRPGFQF